MPEPEEFIQAGYQLEKFVLNRFKDRSSFAVQRLVFDATNAEQKRLTKSAKLSRGLPDTLERSYNIVRGTNKAQTDLWPPMIESGQLSKLVLTEVITRNRALLLKFGDIAVLQMAFLLHTSPQVYDHEQWAQVIAENKETRRNKIGLAFEFDLFVIAFISFDLVFQPTWHVTLDLNTLTPDIGDSMEKSRALQTIANWILQLLSGNSDLNACFVSLAMKSNTVLNLGAYSAQEMMHKCGLPPFATVGEVLGSAASASIMVTAYKSLILDGKEDRLNMYTASIIDGVLAPTKEQRYAAAKKFKVYMKERVYTSERHMAMLKDFEAKLLEKETAADSEGVEWSRKDAGLLHCWEPSLSANALGKEMNLGHVIFGSSKAFVAAGGRLSSNLEDPITCVYRTLGRLNERSIIDTAVYCPLFLAPADLQARWCYTRTYAPTGTSKKMMWTMFPNFPLNSYSGYISKKKRSSDEYFKTISPVAAKIRDENLFMNRIKTNMVALGPLEYCASGIRVKRQGGGGYILAMHATDSALPKFYQERLKKGTELRKTINSQQGKRKVKKNYSKAPRFPFADKTGVVTNCDGEGTAEGESNLKDGGAPVRPEKKRRISADQRLIMSGSSS